MDQVGAGLAGRGGGVARAERVDGEREGRIGLALLNVMERRGVDEDVRRRFLDRARQPFGIADVDRALR